MGMTIDDIIQSLTAMKSVIGVNQLIINEAIETMRKYQKIEDIYYHQSGQALENSLRAVIEDGNDQ